MRPLSLAALVALPLLAAAPAPPAASGALPTAQEEGSAADLAALREAAERAWRAQVWQDVVATHRPLVAAAPDDPVAWHRLGYALHVLGRVEEALPAHERAAALAAAAGPERAEIAAKSTYNVACAHALSGRADEAFAWLDRAVAAGFRNANLAGHDADLASLRDDPRFAELLERMRGERRTVAVVVHEGVEILDFAGPAEVFSAARLPDGSRPYRVVLVGPTREPVRAQHVGGRIEPAHGIGDCPPVDVLVVPGGATQVLLEDEAFLAWVRRVAEEQAEACLSVCTGAFVLAELGLLDGGPATTHASSLAALRRDHPDVEVREGVRYVDGGRVVTSGGVAAGIDGALAVVARQLGEAVAEDTARYLEHAWRRE